MNVEHQLYQTMLLLAGSVNILIAFVLLHSNYWYRDYDVYHRSRKLVALNYLIFALGFLAHAYFQLRTTWPAAATALSVSYFHSGVVLFSWSHTSLLRPDYLTKRIVVRDLLILAIGLASYWTVVVNYSLVTLHIALIIFFAHALFIAFTFYRTYFLVRRNITRLPAFDSERRWWTIDTKRTVLDYQHSFVIGCHVIVLFGFGSIVLTALFPNDLWPYTVLLILGIAVFGYIFYALTEYGRVINSATNATEDVQNG